MRKLLCAVIFMSALLFGCASAPSPKVTPVVSLRDMICAEDNTFCFDNQATVEFRAKKNPNLNYFYLWRI